jgi:hypothetical protein
MSAWKKTPPFFSDQFFDAFFWSTFVRRIVDFSQLLYEEDLMEISIDKIYLNIVDKINQANVVNWFLLSVIYSRDYLNVKLQKCIVD